MSNLARFAAPIRSASTKLSPHKIHPANLASISPFSTLTVQDASIAQNQAPIFAGKSLGAQMNVAEIKPKAAPTSPLKVDRSKIEKELERYSHFYPSCLSLKQITDFGTNLDEDAEEKSCRFLMHELPVRFANMTRMIDSFPELRDMPAIKRVREWYVQAFSDLLSFQRYAQQNGITTKPFSHLISSIFQRHNSIVTTVAQGLMELKKSGRPYNEETISRLLDDFYMTRIGTRMLIRQHLELFDRNNTDNTSRQIPGIIGVFETHCDVAKVVQNAAENAEMICMHTYGCAPKVEIICANKDKGPITITYIPSHIYYVMFELIKNSMRAVVENQPEELPKISIVISKGDLSLTIKVSDLGGGIPQTSANKLFTYLYTTATPQPLEESAHFSSIYTAPLAGFGYGLSLSRLHARYFGGDLSIISMEGYGTDAYFSLKIDASENVPNFNPSIKYEMPPSV